MSGAERILPRPAVVASLAPRDLADARRLVTRVPDRASAIEYRLDLAAERIEPRALLELDSRQVPHLYPQHGTLMYGCPNFNSGSAMRYVAAILGDV